MLFGKTVITFAYELGLRRFSYENSSTENFARDADCQVQFRRIYICEIRPGRSSFGYLSLDVGSD